MLTYVAYPRSFGDIGKKGKAGDEGNGGLSIGKAYSN